MVHFSYILYSCLWYRQEALTRLYSTVGENNYIRGFCQASTLPDFLAKLLAGFQLCTCTHTQIPKSQSASYRLLNFQRRRDLRQLSGHLCRFGSLESSHLQNVYIQAIPHPPPLPLPLSCISVINMYLEQGEGRNLEVNRRCFYLWIHFRTFRKQDMLTSLQ